MDDFFRANFATLKGSEAKLLFTLRILGMGQVSKSELMELSGVTHRKTFYDAWHALEGGGWFDWLSAGTKTELHLVRKPNQEVENRTIPGAETEPSNAKTEPEQYENRTPDGAITELGGAETEPDIEPLLAEADEMDADGLETSLKSNFQLRRKRQMMLLQRAWADLFPSDPVAPVEVQRLLVAARNRATEVYAVMQQAQVRGANHPRAYILKVLQEEAKKKPADDGGLQPVTNEMREAWSKNERLLKANGWAWALE